MDELGKMLTQQDRKGSTLIKRIHEDNLIIHQPLPQFESGLERSLFVSIVKSLKFLEITTGKTMNIIEFSFFL